MSEGSPIPQESNALMRQNHELRQRLQEEANSYRRRLDTYKQATQNQSALVSRLQAKVVQYKQRCSELENQMSETTPICSQFSVIPKHYTGTSNQLPLSTSKILPSAAAPMSLPVICPTDETKPSKYQLDESDQSFERERNEDEKQL